MFKEEKIFSITSLLMKVLYAQMQGSYILAYTLILLISFFSGSDTKVKIT